MKKAFAAIFFLLVLLPSKGQLKQGYEIKVSVNGLKDSTLYLAYHFGNVQYLRDTLKLDKTGKGIFSGNQSLPQGIYMIVLPGKKYFEILIPDRQFFSVSCSYPDFFTTLNFTNSAENTAFIDYQKKWIKLQEYSGKISKRLKDNKQNADSIKIITEIGRANDKKMKDYLWSVVNSNKGNVLGMVVKAIIPVDVPEFSVPAGTKNADSIKWAKSYAFDRDHFFDNIDFGDERILRTPVLYSKLNAYFSNVLIQHPDSIIGPMEKIIARSSSNYKVFQFVSVYLFNHFRESEVMGHDAILVRLADEIYLSGKADWTTKEWRDNLRKEVDRVRPNLIGVRAHEIVMNSFNDVMVSLYDIKKDFTILHFWEPNCGHCQEETPKLKAWYDKNRNQSIEVFAVCTQNDRAKWEKFVKDNKLTWINGWDPMRSSNYDYYYNITSTPTVYILDRNKKIIAKKLPVESIGTFIDNYKKYH